jgi:glycosyltransferase involved in cell wall biosynthesis
MLVSIIIPAYNAEHTLEECLQACLAQTYPDFEVIVVDDGSTDSTPDIAKSIDGIQYVHQENGGPAKARNTGARHAKGEIIAYTDSDCIPEPDWIEQLVALFEEGVTAVGGTYGIANPDSRLAQFIHEEIAYRHKKFEKEVDFLGSFNVAYRKKDFDELGGFDERFKIASGEDNDLAYRLHDYCGKLYFAKKAIVNHHHPEKLSPYLRTQMRHGFWRMKIYAIHPHRSSGDRYAGLAAFMEPPLAHFNILMGVLTLIAIAYDTPILPLSIMLTTVSIYILIQMPLISLMFRRRGFLNGFLFPFILFLRDVARGIGLIKGVWHFIILKRETL